MVRQIEVNVKGGLGNQIFGLAAGWAVAAELKKEDDEELTRRFGLPLIPGYSEKSDTIVHLKTRSSAAFAPVWAMSTCG